MFLVFSAIKLKNKNKKIIYVNITSNSTENNGFKSWCHWKPGPDEQGLEIHNILQCVWKQRNTFFFFSFLLVCYPMKMGKILRWGIQRRMSSSNRNTSEKISTAVTEGNWATRIYLPILFATIHQKEKAGKQKKTG